MTEVRTKGNYEQWVKFFLQAIMESAEDAMLVFNYLEYNPIIEIRKTAKALGITFNSVSNWINRLVDAGILVQTSNASRNRTFGYESYLDILRKGTWKRVSIPTAYTVKPSGNAIINSPVRSIATLHMFVTKDFSACTYQQQTSC